MKRFSVILDTIADSIYADTYVSFNQFSLDYLGVPIDSIVSINIEGKEVSLTQIVEDSNSMVAPYVFPSGTTLADYTNNYISYTSTVTFTYLLQI